MSSFLTIVGNYILTLGHNVSILFTAITLDFNHVPITRFSLSCKSNIKDIASALLFFHDCLSEASLFLTQKLIEHVPKDGDGS